MSWAYLEKLGVVGVQRPCETESYLLGQSSLLCLLSSSFGSGKDGWFCKRRLRAFASLLTALSLSDVSDSQNIAPQLQAHGFGECLHRKPLISLRKRGAQSRDFNIFQFSQGKPEHGCCCQGNHLLPPRALCIRVSLHLSALQGNIIALCLGKGF